MDTSTIIVVGMILKQSYLSFKLIMLTLIQLIFCNLNMHSTSVYLIKHKL